MPKKLHIEPDIRKAKTLHKDFYIQADYYEAAKEKIFAKSWQFISHHENVSKQGDVVPFILLKNYLDEPLILTCDKDNELHCLSNVCTHRGNLLAYEIGRAHV